MKDTFRIEIEMDQMMCSTCKKSSSEYYEMILHLRFIGFEDEIKMKEKLFNILTKNFNSINKFEEVENGFNVYFRTHGEMNKIYKIFQKDYLVEEKRSNKLAGVDRLRSKKLYRYFQSIILYNIEKGDKALLKGEEYYIKAINKNNELVLLDVVTGAKKVVNYSIVKDYFKVLEKGTYKR